VGPDLHLLRASHRANKSVLSHPCVTGISQAYRQEGLTPAARMLSRATRQLGSFWKAFTASPRACALLRPSMRMWPTCRTRLADQWAASMKQSSGATSLRWPTILCLKSFHMNIHVYLQASSCDDFDNHRVTCHKSYWGAPAVCARPHRRACASLQSPKRPGPPCDAQRPTPCALQSEQHCISALGG
jgi:hypothetical protein